MTSDVSFKDEIADLESKLDAARARLAELEAKREKYDFQTEECRAALQRLRAAASGQLPERGRRAISPVDVNPESGRPARGARQAQIVRICRRLGAGGEPFRTADVLHKLRDVEGKLTDGMRSYTYALMTRLEEQNTVEKVGRGKWVIAT